MALRELFTATKDSLAGAKNSAGKSIMRFQQIDVETTARKLKLQDQARKNGAENLPRSDSETLDAVEQGVVEEVRNILNFYYQDYLQNAKVYAQRLSEMNPKTKKDLIRSESETAVAAIEASTTKALNRLHPARDNAVALGNGLRDFKAEHKIRRPPKRYDKSKVLGIGVLAVIALAEAILNGIFLAKGSSFGLVGGVVEALTLALVNILIAAFAGRIIMPHMQYRGFIKAVGAWLGFFIYLGIAVGFNLVIGHYRDAAGVNPLEAAQAAALSFRADPFGITDLRSWFLVAMGFVFSIVALIDTFVMDDPYPGYGAIYRQWKKAAETYYRLHQQESDALQDQLDYARGEIDALLASVESTQSSRGSIISSMQSLKDSMREYERHAGSSLNLLLKTYRDANLAARTDPPPKRFVEGSEYKLDELNLDSVEFGNLDPSSAGAGIEDAADIHRAALETLMAASRKAQGSFDELRRLMLPLPTPEAQ